MLEALGRSIAEKSLVMPNNHYLIFHKINFTPFNQSAFKRN